MSVAEALVQQFLSHNCTFLVPQYTLGDPERWHADLDFVVLLFDEKAIVAVEVSDAGDLGSVRDKARCFRDDEYFERLKEQVTTQTNGLVEDWSVQFLGFLRDRQQVEKACRLFPDERFHFRPMRDTIEDSWSIRKDGLLPKRSMPLT